MQELRKQLGSMENIEKRKKKSLLTELMPVIQEATRSGYTLVDIHAVIEEHIPTLPWTTFKTTYHRIQREIKKLEEAKVLEPKDNDQNGVLPIAE